MRGGLGELCSLDIGGDAEIGLGAVFLHAEKGENGKKEDIRAAGDVREGVAILQMRSDTFLAPPPPWKQYY